MSDSRKVAADMSSTYVAELMNQLSLGKGVMQIELRWRVPLSVTTVPE